MFDFISKFKNIRSVEAKFGRIPYFILRFALLFIAGFILLWITDRLFLLSVSRSYVQQIAEAFDLNRHLAEAISLAVAVLLVAFVSLAFSFSRPKRLAGILGIVGLLIANSLALWQGTKNLFFEASGVATKCYVMTPKGVRFGEHAGLDLETGKQCRPVTPDMLERLQQYSEGKNPNESRAATRSFSI